MMQNDARFLRTTAIPSSKMQDFKDSKNGPFFYHRSRSLGAQNYGKMMHDSDGCLCHTCSSKTSGDKPFFSIANVCTNDMLQAGQKHFYCTPCQSNMATKIPPFFQ